MRLEEGTGAWEGALLREQGIVHTELHSWKSGIYHGGNPGPLLGLPVARAPSWAQG